MMFGDMGHGLLMFIFVTWLFSLSRARVEELGLGIVYKCRYILIMMAFFSIYFGLLYNEYFAIPVPFTSSCYSSETG